MSSLVLSFDNLEKQHATEMLAVFLPMQLKYWQQYISKQSRHVQIHFWTSWTFSWTWDQVRRHWLATTVGCWLYFHPRLVWCFMAPVVRCIYDTWANEIFIDERHQGDDQSISIPSPFCWGFFLFYTEFWANGIRANTVSVQKRLFLMSYFNIPCKRCKWCNKYESGIKWIGTFCDCGSNKIKRKNYILSIWVTTLWWINSRLWLIQGITSLCDVGAFQFNWLTVFY